MDPSPELPNTGKRRELAKISEEDEPADEAPETETHSSDHSHVTFSETPECLCSRNEGGATTISETAMNPFRKCHRRKPSPYPSARDSTADSDTSIPPPDLHHRPSLYLERPLDSECSDDFNTPLPDIVSPRVRPRQVHDHSLTVNGNVGGDLTIHNRTSPTTHINGNIGGSLIINNYVDIHNPGQAYGSFAPATNLGNIHNTIRRVQSSTVDPKTGIVTHPSGLRATGNQHRTAEPAGNMHGFRTTGPINPHDPDAPRIYSQTPCPSCGRKHKWFSWPSHVMEMSKKERVSRWVQNKKNSISDGVAEGYCRFKDMGKGPGGRGVN